MSAPVDCDSEVGEGVRYWRLRFVDCYHHVGDLIEGEATIRDAAGHCLDEVEGLPRDHIHHLIRDLSVVDSPRQIIGAGVQLHVEFDVNDEGLPIPALLGEHPVAADGGQARDRDSVDDLFLLRPCRVLVV